MQPPLISVLMPVYNVEAYVAEAIESILAQTFSDFEFVIVDDGSKDRSLRTCREFAARDSRIVLISQPNGGISRALNRGLSVARGELIARMDADDTTDPTRFALQVEYLREHPEVVVVGTQGELIDPAGQFLWNIDVPMTHEEIDAKHMNSGGTNMLHNAVMIRRETLARVGGYRPEMDTTEDLDLWLRMAEVGRLANMPQRLVKYRRHVSSTWAQHRPRQYVALEACTRDAYRRRGLDWPKDWKHPLDLTRQDRLDPRVWGWRALLDGRIADARRYARMSIRRSPLSWESWKLVACSIRGH